MAIFESDSTVFSEAVLNKADRLGIVYCLKNQGMPYLYKIGWTGRSVKVRSKELYQGYQQDYVTGVPFPFETVREWSFSYANAEYIEKLLHRSFSDSRPNPNREFFKFKSDQHAIERIETVLEQFDWIATARAEAAQKVAEMQARTKQEEGVIAAKRSAEKRAKDRTAEIMRVTESTKAALYKDAAQQLHNEGIQNGLKWGTVWGVGALIFFDLISNPSNTGAFLIFLIVAAFAYYLSCDTPLNQYLSSQEFKAKLEAACKDAQQQLNQSINEIREPTFEKTVSIAHAELDGIRSSSSLPKSRPENLPAAADALRRYHGGKKTDSAYPLSHSSPPCVQRKRVWCSGCGRPRELLVAVEESMIEDICPRCCATTQYEVSLDTNMD